jgi:flagellar biosynthesis protein FlhG
MGDAVTTRSAQTAPRLANGIAVASGKGGVGKTWLSATLCQVLAKQGHRVLLFDGDLGLANVDIQLGLSPAKDLGGFLSGQYPLSEAVSRCGDGCFDVIAGRSGSGSLASLPAEALAKLGMALIEISSGYDWVILDLGAGVERTVRQLATLARTCLIVATDEPTAMTDAYAMIKLTRMHSPNADLRLVINMAQNRMEGERTYATLRKACESFLKMVPPLAGIIKRDPKVRDAIRHQVPLLVRHPRTPAVEDVETVARQVLQGP